MNDKQVEDLAKIEALSSKWLTQPDFADRLGTTPKSVRSALADHRIVGVKLGQPKVLMIPEEFLIAAHLANPADAKQDDGSGKLIILPSLRGTIIALQDAGFNDDRIVEWLLTIEESLDERPIDTLHAGNKSAVRRATQQLLW